MAMMIVMMTVMTQIIIKNANFTDSPKITLTDTFRNVSSRETDVKYIWKSFLFLKSF